MIRKRREAALDIYNLVFAAFLVASPWLFGFARGIGGLDAWISGALIALLAVAALFRFAEWEEWVILLVGLWLLLSPWLINVGQKYAVRIDVVVGFLVFYMAAIELWLIHYIPADGSEPQAGH